VATVFVALGGNIGNREANLRTALQGITRMARVEAVSSLYETEPEGPPQPKYLNAVCRLETGLTPESLLRFLQGLEHEIGRRRAGGDNEPRVIDLDILLYDDVVIDSPDLTVPHPRMAARAFVMTPLAEIAPEITVNGRAAGEVAAELAQEGIKVRAGQGWDGVVTAAQDVRL
jgi:2-amino-4-hydroxy-6-hydroxymethyldihydropteridine diphosphokinase